MLGSSEDTNRVHGDIEGERLSAHRQMVGLLRRIPRGRVMNCGQISILMVGRLSPRAAGWMHWGPDGVPRQKVVNASGGCSTDRLSDFLEGLQ